MDTKSADDRHQNQIQDEEDHDPSPEVPEPQEDNEQEHRQPESELAQSPQDGPSQPQTLSLLPEKQPQNHVPIDFVTLGMFIIGSSCLPPPRLTLSHLVTVSVKPSLTWHTDDIDFIPP